MNYFTSKTITAMNGLDEYDVVYCKKLAQRFEHLGISQKAGAKAIQDMAECHAVPQFISKASIPFVLKQPVCEC